MSGDNNPVLSEELLNTIRYLIQDKDLTRMSRNLRLVFFDYLRFQNAGLDVEFDAILNDIESIIDLLEVIEDESKSWRDKLK